MLGTVLLAAALLFPAAAQSKADTVAQGTILHCWCWSFNTIRGAMKDIAGAGFTAIQTSPINTCHVGDYGGLALMSSDNTGKWYYHYQPTDWQIGNYQLGTRDEFKAMCDEAKKYNITVIVDVLPNHTTPVTKYSRPELEHLFSVVGGEDKLYHANGFNLISKWDDRYECTTGEMGGLPDVNTENPDFQAYYMQFVNDAIDCGAGGFRYDTAKHIGLPDDPKDKKSEVNNFWPVFTGKEPIRGVMLKDADNLFIYGEVIQMSNAREGEYAKWMRVTASQYGDKLRLHVRYRNLTAAELAGWDHPAPGSRLVTWVESHDNYKEGSSTKLTNFQLRAGYAVLAARRDGTPLFFSRPQGPEATLFPGVSQIGDIGNDQFKDPETAAVNAFRTAMAGTDERMYNGDEHSLLFIERGDKGVVLINDGREDVKIKAETHLPDGTYKDHAHGIKFTVKNGMITGKMKSEQIAVVY